MIFILRILAGFNGLILLYDPVFICLIFDISWFMNDEGEKNRAGEFLERENWTLCDAG